MILPEDRDLRFITIRRGGTLTDSDHRLLALWAAACAEHVLHFCESVQPSHRRPRQAIEQIRAWTRGEIRMSESRAAGGHAMGAARELSGAARHGAYAAGQAAVVAHVAAHELGAELGLTGELLLWAKETGVVDDEPLFFSRKRAGDGSRRSLRRGQAWLIVKEASERAGVGVLALRASKHGLAGEPAPVYPHLFRHARVRQIVRQTRSLPLAQRQAGWSRLQPAYLSIGDEEARRMMRDLTE